MTSKKIGAAETKDHPIGAKCTIQRHGFSYGEFMVWFRNKHYVTISANELHDKVTFTDGKVSL